MKKKLFIVIILSLSTATLFAQGMVGVNTIHPQHVLHVDGAKDNASATEADALKLQNDVVVTSEGRVGIGTVNPRYMLELYTPGNSPVFPNISLNTPDKTSGDRASTLRLLAGNGFGRIWSPESVAIMIDTDNNSENESFRITSNVSGLMGPPVDMPLFIVKENGNTGINTNNPTEKFHVKDGNVRIENINNNTSTSSADKVVVADATGVLKTKNANVFTNLPTYTSDAAADADTRLPSGGLYKLSTAGRQVFVKP